MVFKRGHAGGRMQNFLVCFYLEKNTDMSHRVLVRDDTQDSVSEKAKSYFRDCGVPESELAFFTVERYGQAKIDFVKVI